MSKIVLENVYKRFGAVTAVNNLSLEIPSGSFTTLLGPSGCGKTTTLRAIAGLENPTEGTIWIGDQCVFSGKEGKYVPAGKRQLGLVFQSYALWPHLTVYDNIGFGLQIAKISSSEIKRRVMATAKTLQIDDLVERYPSELSGGQQQRVAIARVLVMEPNVLLLDEPLSNLDSKLRMDMRAELKRLHVETGSTIVYVTHDQLEALTLSTHVAILDRGILQQWAPPMTVYNNPQNVFTADFIGNPRINLFDAELKGTSGDYWAQAAGFTIPLRTELDLTQLKGKKIRIGLRAEDLTIENSPQPGFQEGMVYSILPAGSEWFVKISLGDEILMISTSVDPKLEINGPVWVMIEEDKVKCFDEKGLFIRGVGIEVSNKGVKL